MYVYYFITIFLTITIGSGNDVTRNNSTMSNKPNQTLEAHEIINNNILINNKTKIEKFTEGGAISPKDTPLMLPAENHTNLITLDKEIGKTKEKSIVARKGVVYNPQDNNATSNMNSRKDRIDSTLTKSKTIDEKPDSIKDIHTDASVQPHFNNTTASNNTTKLNETNKQLAHKKPLVLSYEALSDINKNAQSGPEVMAKIESSSKPVVSDQLPTPRVIVRPMNANRHPGMVMPIVITILVVPVFAALGYMALRKGKEAWNNRHYKRVDFLLDGMYND